MYPMNEFNEIAPGYQYDLKKKTDVEGETTKSLYSHTPEVKWSKFNYMAEVWSKKKRDRLKVNWAYIIAGHPTSRNHSP